MVLGFGEVWLIGSVKSGVSLLSVAKSLLRECLLHRAGETAGRTDARARDALLNLQHTQRKLLEKYRRLGIAEQALAEFVRGRQSRPGRQAARQVENERRRLGRELHTGVGQLLAAIRLQTELIGDRLSDPEPAVVNALGRIDRLLQDALDQVRSISSLLYPPNWQQMSLEEALGHLWELSGIPERFDGHFRFSAAGWEPDLDLKILLYRAAQEGLSNVARHSRAHQVFLTLEAAEERLVLRIRDDGVGIMPAQGGSRGGLETAGIGLRTIREQAESLGGKMSLESGPDGTTLEVSVPRCA